jgi:hypothetical protein
MRFYSRNPVVARFKTDVDKTNWYACHRVIENYSDKDIAILIRVYGGYDTLSDNVYEVAKQSNIDQNIIWELVKEFERAVAKKRGLI